MYNEYSYKTEHKERRKIMSEFDLAYIANRRKELKLTCQEMAEKLGFKGHSVYWKYEHGDYKFKADMLPTLASALRCNVKNFYTKKC
jgi:transcriptional regulator with XRE-family HTH domain